MSRVEPKAGVWLRQQAAELGALRNASVRDPQFKAWRQNTLTFIQRIWPGDSTRSERFRRIPFTPPSTRHDARVGREHFERGCGEALEYLNTLLASLAASGVAALAEPAADDAATAGPTGAPLFPPALPAGAKELPLNPGDSAEAPQRGRSSGPPELPASASRPAPSDAPIELFRGFQSPPESEDVPRPLLRPALDASATGAATEPPVPGAGAVGPGGQSSVASTGRISVRGAPERSAAQPEVPLAHSLKDFFEPPARKPELAPRSAKQKGRNGGKQRLKDMLGLSSLETPGESGTMPVYPVLPAATPAPLSAEASVTPPSEPANDPTAWTLPEFMTPQDSVLPLTAADIEPAANTAAGDTVDNDARLAAHVTSEFLANSPVLSSLPRPVPHRAAEPKPAAGRANPSPGPAAAQLLAIAAEVDQFGVPEGHRARARAALGDLARELDGHEVSWDVLREAVHFVMEYPPLARRTLPLLLPFLDLAA